MCWICRVVVVSLMSDVVISGVSVFVSSSAAVCLVLAFSSFMNNHQTAEAFIQMSLISEEGYLSIDQYLIYFCIAVCVCVVSGRRSGSGAEA